MGDIVKKLGERVLPAVVPTLREVLSLSLLFAIMLSLSSPMLLCICFMQGLKSSSAEKRQGVCLGLSEVIGSSTKRQLEDFLGLLIEAVQV